MAFAVAQADWIPVIGFSIDSRGNSLRPIQGLPGGALLGNPLDLPFTLQSIRVLVSGNLAIAIDTSESHVVSLISGLRTGGLNATPVPGAIQNVDLVAVNQPGSAAVLYSKSTSQLQFLSGLPDHVQASDPITLGVAGDVSALGVSADGSFVLVGVAGTEGASGGVYEAANDPGAQPFFVAVASEPSAIALLHSDHDAIIADRANNEIVLVRDIGGANQREWIAGERQDISGPAALRVIGERVLIANQRTPSLNCIDLVTRASQVYPLMAPPDRIESLLQPGMYALNQAGGNPLLILAADQPDLQIWFVPQD
jgi:hypothetical protein